MLKKLLSSIVIPATSIYITSLIVDGIQLTTLESLVILTILLGVLNTFLKPILKLLTLPLNIISLGLFSFALNGIVLMIGFSLCPGVNISGLSSATIASLIISLINTFLNKIIE